jgi:hypothetical protein
MNALQTRSMVNGKVDADDVMLLLFGRRVLLSSSTEVVVVVVVLDDSESIRGTRTLIRYERIILPLPGQSLPTATSWPPKANAVKSFGNELRRASPKVAKLLVFPTLPTPPSAAPSV